MPLREVEYPPADRTILLWMFVDIPYHFLTPSHTPSLLPVTWSFHLGCISHLAESATEHSYCDIGRRRTVQGRIPGTLVKRIYIGEHASLICIGFFRPSKLTRPGPVAVDAFKGLLSAVPMYSSSTSCEKLPWMRSLQTRTITN